LQALPDATTSSSSTDDADDSDELFLVGPYAAIAAEEKQSELERGRRTSRRQKSLSAQDAIHFDEFGAQKDTEEPSCYATISNGEKAEEGWWDKLVSGSTWRHINKEFIFYTSAHGFKEMYTGPRFRRWLWSLFVVLSLGVTFFLSSQIIKEYNEKPTGTAVDIESTPEIVFPDITVCNLNGFRLNAV
jgi:hypothetical protein